LQKKISFEAKQKIYPMKGLRRYRKRCMIESVQT
jgi:hypothetical protein